VKWGALQPGIALTSFDIGWVDQSSQRYYLADRSNFAVDIFDAEDNFFLGRVGGFRGAQGGNNDIAGPNGILVIPRDHQLWAGDGNSTVKVIDLALNPPAIVDTISTGGKNRADEMAYDPRDHILLVANDAEDTPFVTFISTKTHAVLGKIFFPLASNGLEQPVWDSKTRRFYLSVPEANGPGTGEIAVINPKTMTITDHFPVGDCEPAGLVLGPHQHLLVGCQDPAKVLIVNARTGAIVATITQVGGADQVWFNRGDDRYYVAARNNLSGPVLGVIDAETNTWLQNVPTAFNAHSVAANAENNHIFVPLRPPRPGTTDLDPCTQFGVPGHGCIGVYAMVREHHADEDEGEDDDE